MDNGSTTFQAPNPFCRITPTVSNPVCIYFTMKIFRIAILIQNFQCYAITEFLQLKAMIVVGKD